MWGQKSRINLTDYTEVNSYNNGKFKVFKIKALKIELSCLNRGNNDYLECGVIKDGPCRGDQLWGIGIREADDQEGCEGKGFRADVALVRRIWVYGKCWSRCGLGWSIRSWNRGVNNWGSVGYAAEEKVKRK